MDLFTDVSKSPSELARIFSSLGLAEKGAQPVAVPLTGGVSSGIYRVDVGDRSYCLKQALPQLKVEKEWKVPVDRVFAEIDWLRTAGEIVPGHVPKVLGQDDLTKSFVMEYLAEGHAVWKTELLLGRISASVARQVGEVIGRIHAATAFSAVCAQRFETDDNFYAIRLEPYLEETGRRHPELQARLNSLIERTRTTKIALVHGDLSPKNILIGPNGPVILDAECAWYGDPAFDVAFCLNHLLIKGAWRPNRMSKLLECFEALKEAYFAQVSFEERDGLEERIATLLPALSLARIDGKSPVEYLDVESRGRIREVASDLIKKEFSRLEDVSSHWKMEFMK